MRPTRPRASGAVAGLTVLAAVLVSGCTSGGSVTAARSVSASAPPSASSSAVASASAPGQAVPSLPSSALASPGCSSATAAGPALGSVRSAMLDTGRGPFGVAVTPDGRWAFVALTGAMGGAAGAVGVLRLGTGGGPPAGPAVKLVRTVSLPVSPVGATITPDGKYLLVAAGSGAAVISVARAEAGATGALLGTLAVPGGASASGPASRAFALNSAIEVAVSPDGRFAFVTLEDADEAVVFNLAGALSRGFGAADYVGAIPLGQAPVGMAVSPDGRWLYATSEGAVAGQRATGLTPAGGCTSRVTGTIPGEPPGTLTVVDLAQAETDPAGAVVATVDAGYQPVRVVTAADGTQVWVTARASDDLLCFAAAGLASDPARALVAIVRVGSEPVGLAAAAGGALIVVADSNRFAASGANSALTVVNVAAALAGRPAVTGEIATGLFPRDMAVSSGGTLIVSDFSSGQVQAVATAGLPGRPAG